MIYAQYGVYAFLAVLVVVAIYLHVLPSDVGIPIFTSIVGLAIGWHIPTPTDQKK